MPATRRAAAGVEPLRIPAADLQLLAEGAHPRPWTVLGAQPLAGGTAFAVWAPAARAVSVATDEAGRAPLQPIGAAGVWGGVLPGIGPGDRYHFAITGRDRRTVLHADPMALWAELRPGTASRVAPPSAHAWSDDAWLAARRGADPHRSAMRAYEVHLGSWRRHPDGSWLSYEQIGPLLAAHCQRLGFTHVELLPVAEHPFDGSWGYQVTGYYAPTSRFGTPDGLRAMIDHLHRSGIGVILDWVPAHFPRDEHALARFDGGPLYEHADPMRGEHPDWGTLVFDYGRPGVRNFLVANALYWLDEFHIDGLRVDAVASMLYLDYSRKPGQWRPNLKGGKENLEALAFLRELNQRVHAAHPDALTVAEESTAFPGVTRPIADGGLGFDLKWDMGWMHDMLDYFKLASERWMLPLSHDEVVHLKRSLLGKMPGGEAERFAGLRTLLANQVAQPGKKLLFMGAELGVAGEWDHDRQLPWQTATQPLRRGLGRYLADLGRLYLARPALWQADEDPSGFTWLDLGERDGTTFAWLRRGLRPDGTLDHLVVIQNMAAVPRHRRRIALPLPGEWRVALNSDARRYGGAGPGRRRRVTARPVPWGTEPASALLTLPALGTLFLVPEE
jgi:1,4-alpha-glucan branching enzyme